MQITKELINQLTNNKSEDFIEITDVADDVDYEEISVAWASNTSTIGVSFRGLSIDILSLLIAALHFSSVKYLHIQDVVFVLNEQDRLKFDALKQSPQVIFTLPNTVRYVMVECSEQIPKMFNKKLIQKQPMPGGKDMACYQVVGYEGEAHVKKLNLLYLYHCNFETWRKMHRNLELSKLTDDKPQGSSTSTSSSSSKLLSRLKSLAAEKASESMKVKVIVGSNRDTIEVTVSTEATISELLREIKEPNAMVNAEDFLSKELIDSKTGCTIKPTVSLKDLPPYFLTQKLRVSRKHEHCPSACPIPIVLSGKKLVGGSNDDDGYDTPSPR